MKWLWVPVYIERKSDIPYVQIHQIQQYSLVCGCHNHACLESDNLGFSFPQRNVVSWHVTCVVTCFVTCDMWHVVWHLVRHVVSWNLESRYPVTGFSLILTFQHVDNWLPQAGKSYLIWTSFLRKTFHKLCSRYMYNLVPRVSQTLGTRLIHTSKGSQVKKPYKVSQLHDSITQLKICYKDLVVAVETDPFKFRIDTHPWNPI